MVALRPLFRSEESFPGLITESPLRCFPCFEMQKVNTDALLWGRRKCETFTSFFCVCVCQVCREEMGRERETETETQEKRASLLRRCSHVSKAIFYHINYNTDIVDTYIHIW